MEQQNTLINTSNNTSVFFRFYFGLITAIIPIVLVISILCSFYNAGDFDNKIIPDGYKNSEIFQLNNVTCHKFVYKKSFNKQIDKFFSYYDYKDSKKLFKLKMQKQNLKMCNNKTGFDYKTMIKQDAYGTIKRSIGDEKASLTMYFYDKKTHSLYCFEFK